MVAQILPKDKFDSFAQGLLDGRRLMAPVAKGPQFAFAQIESKNEVGRIQMDYDVSMLSPKKYMLPPHEKLLSFTGRGPEGVTNELEAEPTAILGVHPYDLVAMSTLDAAMLSAPADRNYAARRKVTTIIGMNIQEYASDYQFMADVGSADAPEGSYDLFLTDLGDRYYVEVGSDNGEKLVADSGVFAPAGDADAKAKADYDAAKKANLVNRLPYPKEKLPELLDSSYDSLLWDAIATRCFSCGACTNVCPTCYCFDVNDKLNMDATSGVRERKWDSCQLGVFAEVAGGENFREERASRLRHRMFRKGKFIQERTGQPGCVGCGRCSFHCVAKISILEAFQQIADEVAEVQV
jgi:ferredoxin